jgi:hypothetical protein
VKGKETSWILREIDVAKISLLREREVLTCVVCDWEDVLSSEVIGENEEGWGSFERVALVVPSKGDGEDRG